MGLAFASTGWVYPLFGTLLGRLGVALRLDTASNVLFGKRCHAQHLGPLRALEQLGRELAVAGLTAPAAAACRHRTESRAVP